MEKVAHASGRWNSGSRAGWAVILLGLCAGTAVARPQSVPVPVPVSAPAPGSLDQELASAPDGFVANVGQWPAEFLYRWSRAGLSVWVLADGLLFDARHETQACESSAGGVESLHVRGHVMRWRFEGASAARPEPLDPADVRITYTRGATAERAVCARRLVQRGVWPGVDLVLRASASGLAFDLELDPLADIESCIIAVEGASELEAFCVPGAPGAPVTGGLRVRIPSGDSLRLAAPLAWQRDAAGDTELVAVRIEPLAGDRFRFIVDGRDKRRALVVDPGLEWSTYLGEDDVDYIVGVGLAPNDEVIVAGVTLGPFFPTTVGAYDESINGGSELFVVRFDSSGSGLVYATYIGGSGADLAWGLRVDDVGRAVVVGETYSADFPTTQGAYDTSFGGFSDAFCLRLSADGAALEFSTLLGGSALDRANDLVLAPNGEIVLVGSTRSVDFPVSFGVFDRVHGGALDGFVARLSSDGSTRRFATFLGSSDGDSADTVALFDDDSMLVGGSTFSSGFPATAFAWDRFHGGLLDGYVTRIAPGATGIAWSTFVGGGKDDDVRSVAILPDGRVAAAGETHSADLALAAGALDASLDGESDGYVLALSSDGRLLEFGTLLGGTGEDRITAIEVRSDGALVFAGETTSEDFPISLGAYDDKHGTFVQSLGEDAVFGLLESDASVLGYSSFLGGTDVERVNALTLHPGGGIVLAGSSISTNFPTTPGAFDRIYDQTFFGDGFVTRIDFSVHPFRYGQAKVSSTGATPRVFSTGFPSVTGIMFVSMIGGIPGQPAWGFYGPNEVDLPFFGGRRLAGGPLTRLGPYTLSFLGDTFFPFEMDRRLIGTTQHIQFWFRDPGDPSGVGLTEGLKVRFYP